MPPVVLEFPLGTNVLFLAASLKLSHGPEEVDLGEGRWTGSERGEHISPILFPQLPSSSLHTKEMMC